MLQNADETNLLCCDKGVEDTCIYSVSSASSTAAAAAAPDARGVPAASDGGDGDGMAALLLPAAPPLRCGKVELEGVVDIIYNTFEPN